MHSGVTLTTQYSGLGSNLSDDVTKVHLISNSSVCNISVAHKDLCLMYFLYDSRIRTRTFEIYSAFADHWNTTTGHSYALLMHERPFRKKIKRARWATHGIAKSIFSCGEEKLFSIYFANTEVIFKCLRLNKSSNWQTVHGWVSHSLKPNSK